MPNFVKLAWNIARGSIETLQMVPVHDIARSSIKTVQMVPIHWILNRLLQRARNACNLF